MGIDFIESIEFSLFYNIFNALLYIKRVVSVNSDVVFETIMIIILDKY